MPASSRAHAPSLPQNGPRRVRSAIVHVASMANVALTAARGPAEHHFDAQVRLRAENVRLEQEIALLREALEKGQFDHSEREWLTELRLKRCG